MGPIAIKGGKDGLRLMLAPDAAWPDVLAALHDQLQRGPEFFHGAEVLVDTGERALSEDELQTLLAAMLQYGLQPHALLTSTREGRQAARSQGLETRAARPAAPAAPAAESDGALLVQRTLRSGQVLRHPGHITVIGDINPGAEVIAGGSIVVWGRARGKIHAGALGDEQALICALELTPTMLQIGSKLAGQPDSRPLGPEVAHVTAQGVEVAPWEIIRR